MKGCTSTTLRPRHAEQAYACLAGVAVQSRSRRGGDRRLRVYRGRGIPSLRGFYVFGGYATGRVWAMKGPGATPSALPGADVQVAPVSSFGQDAAGELSVVDIGGAV